MLKHMNFVFYCCLKLSYIFDLLWPKSTVMFISSTNVLLIFEILFPKLKNYLKIIFIRLFWNWMLRFQFLICWLIFRKIRENGSKLKQAISKVSLSFSIQRKYKIQKPQIQTLHWAKHKRVYLLWHKYKFNHQASHNTKHPLDHKLLTN